MAELEVPEEHQEPAEPPPGPAPLIRNLHGELQCGRCEVPVAHPPSSWCSRCRAGLICPGCGSRWWPDGSPTGWAERGRDGYPRRHTRASTAYDRAEHPTLAAQQALSDD